MPVVKFRAVAGRGRATRPPMHYARGMDKSPDPTGDLPREPTPGPTQSEPIVLNNVPCAFCSKNLRGVPEGGDCPKCGAPVEDSLRRNTFQFAPPEHVKSIRRGLSLILNGILLFVALFAAFMLVGIIWQASLMNTQQSPFVMSTHQTPFTVAFALGMAAIYGMVMFGFWKYAAPDPGLVGREPPQATRKLLRASIVASISLMALNLVLIALGINLNWMLAQSARELAAYILFSCIGGFTAIAHFISCMMYTAWLAGRVPDEYIKERATRYLWLLPVLYFPGVLLCGLGPVIAVVLFWNLLNRLRKELKAIQATLSP
jgi:hypothetical protein